MLTNIEKAQMVKDYFDDDLRRLQVLARHGNAEAARRIIVTMTVQNLALKALGYRLNYEDSDDNELHPLTTAEAVVS